MSRCAGEITTDIASEIARIGVMYSARLLDHFENPRNSGTLPDATVSASVENPVCADVVELSLRIDDGVIAAATFRSKGCVPAMACASALTTIIVGVTVGDAEDVTVDAVVDEVGGVPPASQHAAQLAVEVLKTALRLATKKAASRG
jgi:nitrogen fixation NifU-like protein